MKNQLLTLGVAMFALTMLVSCAGAKKTGSKNAAPIASNETKKPDKAGKDKVKAASSGKTLNEATCSLGGDNRILSIVEQGQGGCELVYTKFGESKVMGNSAVNVGYCEELQSRIKGNLTTAGFTCQ